MSPIFVSILTTSGTSADDRTQRSCSPCSILRCVVTYAIEAFSLSAVSLFCCSLVSPMALA